MNCVSYVVIFFYLLELTLKTQVSNTVTEHRWYQFKRFVWKFS